MSTPGAPPVIGVFCSSSEGVDVTYHALAERLGTAIGERGWTLLYGGTPVGCMGTLAAAVRGAGGGIIGVPLRQFVDLGIHDTDADELVATETLGLRKDAMLARSDAFVALPGGFGTLDEVVEVISQRQLRMHHKPLVLVDHAGFFTPLLAFFELLRAQGMAYDSTNGAYEAVETVETAITTLVHHLAEPEAG
jgi:cytokinin riboside 5'-monophosphate phosphoribohydrolase